MRYLLSLLLIAFSFSNVSAQPGAVPKNDEKLASLFAWRDSTNKRLENIEKGGKSPDNSAMISAMQAQIAQLNQQIFTMQQLQIQQLQQQLNRPTPAPGGPVIPLNPNPGPVIPLNPNPGPVIPLNPNPGPVIPLNPNPGPVIPLNPNPGTPIPLIPPQQPPIQLQPPVPINPNPGPGPGGSGYQRFSNQPTISIYPVPSYYPELPPRISGGYYPTDLPPRIIGTHSK